MSGRLERLLDVPFNPERAELVAPIRFSMENRAAMAFKPWAEVDGCNIAIDVMTFGESGKISKPMAYWRPENVTLLD
jgi:hypothetical protein